MTVKYGFYDSLNGDRLYNANDMNTFFEGIFSDGIFEFVGDALQVTHNPGQMSVLVGTGRAWFNNLWIRNTSTLTLTIQPSHMIYDRIDVVILEFDSSITVRENSIKVLTGTPSVTPIPPNLSHTSSLNQYALAHIYVSASSSEIEAVDITNKIGSVNTPYIKSFISDHGSLLGLGDDDHPQYYNQTRGDSRYLKISDHIKGTQQNQTHGSNIQIPASTIYYINPVSFGAGVGMTQVLTIENITILKGGFKINSVQPSSGSLVFTLLKNGLDTTLTFTVPANGAIGFYSDQLHSISLIAGDVYGWKVQNNATTPSANIIGGALVFNFN